MDRSTADSEKDDQDKEELLRCSSEDLEAVEGKSLYKGLGRKVEQGHVFILNFRKSHIGVSCIRESFLRHIQILDNPISKQMFSDEKYLRCCLELICGIGPKDASLNTPLNMGIPSESLNSIKVGNLSSFGFTRQVVKYSVIAGPENVNISSTSDWILGTITKSMSVTNMMHRSLFRQLGPVNSNVKFGRTTLISGREPACFDYVSSPSGASTCSSRTLQKGFIVHGDHRNESEPIHKRLVSVSSTKSTCSDQSLTFAGVHQGMLQCTWNNGLPHYVFSIDDQRQIFVANLNKVDSSDYKVLDYVYSFHSKGNNKKGLEIGENETSIVGNMKVSTSFTLCPNNREVMETRFVLYGSIDNCFSEMQTSTPTHGKKGLLPKKFVDASKTSGLAKHRMSSKIRGTSDILKDSFWKKGQDSCNNLDPLNIVDISENYLPPYLELAAIIVKGHGNHDEFGIGGWGLKFLKKGGISSESSMVPKCCVQNTGDCSMSMEVLIPAGLHGGPRNRDGGPSSLIERWSSGGHCHCGGWDIGCPLTILNTRPSGKEVLPKPDMTGACESVDLFIQGSKGGVPIMKMVNIHDGLYYIHIQSTLSELQSFAIAVAIRHTRTSIFNPKMHGS